jgi:hypothetical protein
MTADIPVSSDRSALSDVRKVDGEWTTGPGLHSCRGPAAPRILHIDSAGCTPQRSKSAYGHG